MNSKPVWLKQPEVSIAMGTNRCVVWTVATACYQSRHQDCEHFATVEYEHCRDQSLRGNPDHFAVKRQCQWWWLQTCLDSISSRSMWTTNELTRSSQTAKIVLSSFNEIYSWVSSAYCERLVIPKLEMTSTIGDTYSENGSLRNAELANHCLGSTATEIDEMGSVTQVWAEPLQCTAGYTKIKIKSRY